MKKLILHILFFTSFILLLLHPQDVLYLTLDGLTQWAAKIVPTLFPFMVMNSLMIQLGLDELLAKYLSPILKHIFPYSSAQGLYVIIIGFLCGFPMGAKTVRDLVNEGKLSISEANYLLSFCNNISPAFFLGLIVPILKEYSVNKIYLYIFGMYGIPLAYGIILGFFHKSKTNPKNNSNIHTNNLHNGLHNSMNYFLVIKNACISSINSIILLGAYIALINSLRIFPYICPLSSVHKSILYIILEINSGIKAIYETNEIYFQYKIIIIMTALSFSGMSCLLQAACFIVDSDTSKNLSLKKYSINKLIITTISLIYYLIIGII